jgi:hypothetical protein
VISNASGLVAEGYVPKLSVELVVWKSLGHRLVQLLKVDRSDERLTVGRSTVKWYYNIHIIRCIIWS